MTLVQSCCDTASALPEASDRRCGASGFARLCDDSLAQSWTRLEKAAFLPTQSLAFSAALARTLLAEAHVEVFHASGADGTEALLPLCRDGGYLDRWRMMGAHEVFEPGDALCENPESAKPLAEVLAREARPLSLDRIPAGSPMVPALKAAMRRKGWVSVRPAMPCPTISLDDRWKQPESCFNAGRRSDFRRAARRAREFGEVSFEMRSPGTDEFDALFDEAIGVELRSWKKEAGTAIAVDRGKEDFFRDYFRSACRQGMARVAFMRIDGQAVAMQLAMECLERYWLFKIGHDEQFGKCSPGTLLMLHALGDAARRELRAFELLGDVEPWIAELWSREQHDCVRLRTYPFNARGAAALAADSAAWLGKRLKRGVG